MTSERCPIGNNIPVSQQAIVGDMTIHHQKIVIAYSSDHSAAGRSRVERDIFSDRIVVTDDQLAGLPFILEILRNRAHAREWEKYVSFSDGGPALDDDVGLEFASFSDLNF